MSLVTLKKVLEGTIEEKYAVGGFVTTDLLVTENIIRAAENKNAKVILMIPWPTVAGKPNREEYLKTTIEMVKNAKVDIVVHLDHGASFEECMLALHSGFTSVMYDGSSLPFEENVAITKKVVEAAHACGVSVEAEIGHVGGAEGGALIKEGKTADSNMYTTVEKAVSFVEATGVDALAVAVGTVHGIFRGTPKLDLERLAAIRSAVDIPLVLHGGSGLSDEDFRNVIANGINKINYFTEMSLAAADGVKEYISQSGDNPVHMMDITSYAYGKLKELVEKQIVVFRQGK